MSAHHSNTCVLKCGNTNTMVNLLVPSKTITVKKACQRLNVGADHVATCNQSELLEALPTYPEILHKPEVLQSFQHFLHISSRRLLFRLRQTMTGTAVPHCVSSAIEHAIHVTRMSKTSVVLTRTYRHADILWNALLKLSSGMSGTYQHQVELSPELLLARYTNCLDP